MKKLILSLTAALISTAALAQSGPPMVGDKPLVQVKPRAAKPGSTKPAKQQPQAVRMQECLEIDDGTKDRLNCYDGVIPPAKPKAIKVKGIGDCKFAKEEDERLACYNGFVESMPKLPRS